MLVAHNSDGTLKTSAVSSAAPVQSVDGQTGAVSLSGSYGPLLITVSAQTDDYTLALADASRAVEVTKGSAATVTVPPNASVAFPIGTVIEIVQMGSGTVTIAAGAGVTLRSRDSILSLAGQYAVASIRKRAANEWVVAGDLL